MTDEPDKRPAFESAAQLIRRTEYDPEMKRPPATTAGAVLLLMRAGAGALWVATLAGLWPEVVASVDLDLIELGGDAIGGAMWVFVAIGATIIAADIVLAVLILRGWNWPRVLVMSWATVFITSSFIGWWFSDEVISIETTLLSIGLDVLLLLALSSREAAAYARRGERRAEPAGEGADASR